MQQYTDTYLRFFDAGQLVAKHFNMEQEPWLWMRPSKIADIIGVPATVGSATQIGQWASKAGLRTRKVKGVRYILMPSPRT